jgi:hypothetical protein
MTNQFSTVTANQKFDDEAVWLTYPFSDARTVAGYINHWNILFSLSLTASLLSSQTPEYFKQNF